MDSATWGLIGGIVGTVGGCLGAYIGARASYKAAVNEAQRRFYRQVFKVMAPVAALFIAAVWLASTGLLPRWVYWMVMVIWFAALGPAIVWMNRRLAALGTEPGAPKGAPTR